MQIRVGNRQDEPTIRTIVEQTMAESGQATDLSGADSDLRNIDANYFWHDGIFIVAEDDGEIVGIAGARKKGDETTLELLRLIVIPERRHQGVGKSLMETVLYFAGNLGYKRLVVEANKRVQQNAKPCLGMQEDDEGVWFLDLKSRKDDSCGKSARA